GKLTESSGATLGQRFARRSRQLFPDPVENPIDETSRFRSAKFFCQLDRLVNRNDGRNVVTKQHFIDGETQDIAIDRGDATKLVVFGITSNALVDFPEMRVHPINERLSKLANARFAREKFPEIFHFFRTVAMLHIAPEMIL